MQFRLDHLKSKGKYSEKHKGQYNIDHEKKGISEKYKGQSSGEHKKKGTSEKYEGQYNVHTMFTMNMKGV